tara:strand:- start:229 stop:510 length:282 start_codon:yes stop_codon:yes gene_type:complete
MTAVEWLEKELKGVYESDYFNRLLEQAKQMEKEQIKELKTEIKALKQVKNLNIPAAIESVCLCTTPIGSTVPDKCGRCGKKIGWQNSLTFKSE